MTNKEHKEGSKIIDLILTFYKGSVNFFLGFEDAKLFTWEAQQNFLIATVQSEIMKLYPMKKEFVRLFFKKLIGFLQQHNQEVHDSFYLHLCTSMVDENEQESNYYYYRHYIIGKDLNEIITIKETNNMVVNGTTGMKTWEAAVMLTDWSLCNTELFKDKNVLELGSGVGLTGISIAKYCKPKSIYMTDMHQDVLNTLSWNVSINFHDAIKLVQSNDVVFKNSNRSIVISLLDWTRLKDFIIQEVPDVIIGADIVYDPSILQPLCNVFAEFFGRNINLQIYIESVVRNEQTFEDFLILLRSKHYKIEDIQQTGPKLLEWNDKIKKKLVKISLI